MSDLEAYLTTTELLDCQGRVEYSLTLLIDGRISIRRGERTITIEPRTGHVDPPGLALPDHLLRSASELAGHPIRVHPGSVRHGHVH